MQDYSKSKLNKVILGKARAIYEVEKIKAILDAATRVCQLTYATSSAGIQYTFEFSKNQTNEIKKTWDWLNTLEGSVQFLEYMSN